MQCNAYLTNIIALK